MPSVPWRVESSKIFKKNQKSFKFPKMPKIVPKSIQTCFERVLGQTFRKFFAQFSTVGRISENFQKKSKKFSKIQKRPKSFPTESKRVLNLIWVNVFEKLLCPVFHGGSRLRKFSNKSKNSQNSKMPKIVPKSIQTCFEHVLVQNFREIFAQFSMECRVFKNFQKNQKSFKFPKMPKIVPKSIQTCFERVLGQTFRKFFAQFSTVGRISENFQKNQKKFSKIQKRLKSFPKESKRVLNLIWVNVFEKFLCSVFHGGSRLRIISKKNQKSFKIPKMPKIVAKSIQTCFEHVLGKIF